MPHGIVLLATLKNNDNCYLLFEQLSSGHFHATPCVSSYLWFPSHDLLALTKSYLFALKQSSISVTKVARYELLPYKPNHLHILLAIACYVTTPCCVPEHSSALPWALDSVHNNPGKQPSCHSSNLLRYIRSLDRAQIMSHLAASTTPLQDLPPRLPLLLLLDVLCPDVEADPVLPCLCPPRELQTFTRK